MGAPAGLKFSVCTEMSSESSIPSDIIRPPPNIRSVLERTAKRVSLVPGLESKILRERGLQAKFSFLQPGDPYNGYYKWVLENSRQSSDASHLKGTPVESDTGRGARQEAGGDVQHGVADARFGESPALEQAERGKESNTNTSMEKGTEGAHRETDSNLSGSVVVGLASNDQHRTSTDLHDVRPGGSLAPRPGRPERPQDVNGFAPSAVSRLTADRLRVSKYRSPPLEAPPDSKYSLPDNYIATNSLSVSVMKLAAQFSARHGDSFTSRIQERESRNALFEFLHPYQSSFNAFRSLTESYRDIRTAAQAKESAGKSALGNLADMDGIMQYAWAVQECFWKAGRGDSRDESGLIHLGAGASHIEWGDFVVLETVDISDAEVDLPAPLADADQIPQAMDAADAAVTENARNSEDVDMEVDLEDGRGESADHGVEVAVAEVDSEIPRNSVRGFQPSQGSDNGRHDIPSHPGIANGVAAGTTERAAGPSVVLPDGQRVPVSEATRAMRTKLLDPRYKEERDRAKQKNIRKNLADGDEIAANLSRLSRSKVDREVYSRVDLQEGLASAHGKRAETTESQPDTATKTETPSKAKHLPGTETLSRRPAVVSLPNSKRQRVIDPPDAIPRASSGLQRVEATSTVGGQVAGGAGQPAVNAKQPLPEDQWIASVGEKIQLCVRAPIHASPDWQLSGQAISFEVPLKSSVFKLKETLTRCTKLPANKQKLQYNGTFLKDRQTLASYNVEPGATLHLEVKERGGKGKRA